MNIIFFIIYVLNITFSLKKASKKQIKSWWRRTKVTRVAKIKAATQFVCGCARSQFGHSSSFSGSRNYWFRCQWPEKSCRLFKEIKLTIAISCLFTFLIFSECPKFIRTILTRQQQLPEGAGGLRIPEAVGECVEFDGK